MKCIIPVFFWVITTAFSVPTGRVYDSAIIDLYRQAFNSHPASGFVVLVFNEENCSFCFNEYNLFWAKNLKREGFPPIFALYVSDRPYTLKEVQKEYHIEVPILAYEPDSLYSILPNIQLPAAIGFTANGKHSFFHRMGENDEIVNQTNGYTKLQELAEGLLKQKKLILRDSVKIDENDNIILGNFQIETFKDGYSISDSKKKRLNLYDRSGKQVEMFDFGDSSKFIGSSIPLYTYSKKYNDTIFCLGAKPLLIQKGPTPEKDMYNLLPNLCIIHNNRIICDTSIPNTSLLPPLVVLKNSIIAKIMKWSALQNEDTLREMPSLVQFTSKGQPAHFFGKVNPIYLKKPQKFEFFGNDIVPESDTSIAILDYLTGRVQIFSDAGNMLADFQYHPLSSADTSIKFEYLQICKDESIQRYYILLRNKDTKKKYISCIDREGTPYWELLEVPQSTERIVRGKDGNRVFLCNKKRNGIYIEQWSLD